MLTITAYSVEKIRDPFGILPGQRFEFILDLDVPEDDELHEESGVYARVIYREQDGERGIVKYELHERGTDRYLDIELEEEELQTFADFCSERYRLAEEG